MGLRLRLKADYDISGFRGQARVVLEALKRYGMLVADQGTSWFITGAPDPGWNDTDLDQLKTVPGDAFEVVQSGTIQVLPPSSDEVTTDGEPDAQGGLAALVPDELWQDCALEGTPRSGALATALCVPASTSPANRPDRWEVSLFPDADAADDGYRAIFESREGVESNVGSCTAVTWSREDEWRHGSGELGGRRQCFVNGADAVIAWTHVQPAGGPHADNHGNMLVEAQSSGPRQPELFDWWSSWRDAIGTTTAS